MLNLNEASTKRGIIWLVTAIIATIFSFFGKDATQVLAIGGAVVGGLGLLPDSTSTNQE